MSDDLVILDLVAKTRGWRPIVHMVDLLVPALGGRRVWVSSRRNLSGWLDFRLGTRRRKSGGPHLLVIAARPEHLGALAQIPGWRMGFDSVSAWIVDSFWTEGIGQRTGLRHFDHLFITWGGDLDFYRDKVSGTVDWLPWGTDALGIACPDGARPCDLQRLGRQPAGWDDEDRIIAKFSERGLTVRGRPGGDASAAAYRELLTKHLAEAKFVLANSNFVDTSHYTHKTKEYLTARWTDAFACGCAVVGVQPVTDPLYGRSVPPEAVVELKSADPDAEFDRICEAIDAWEPSRAVRLHKMALREFDWRWRFRDLARRLGRATPELDRDLETLTALCSD